VIRAHKVVDLGDFWWEFRCLVLSTLLVRVARLNCGGDGQVKVVAMVIASPRMRFV